MESCSKICMQFEKLRAWIVTTQIYFFLDPQLQISYVFEHCNGSVKEFNNLGQGLNCFQKH